MEQINEEYKDLPRWMKILRISIRPVTTYLLTFLFIYAFLHPDVYNTKDMGILSTLLILVYTFWFGERMLKNTGLLKIFEKNMSNDKITPERIRNEQIQTIKD